MPVKIISKSIKPELTGSTVDYLLGNITGKMRAIIVFKAEWIAEAGAIADNEQMIFVAADKTIEWVGGNFEDEGFLDGDTFTITGDATNNGNYTIAAIDGNIITTVEAIVNDTSETAVLTGTKECTGVNFRWNLIENDASPNYNSLVDGNENKFSKSGLDYTDLSNVDMIQQGVYKSNNLGTALVAGLGSLNTFTIQHFFYINPFFLIDQLADLEDEIAPEYFFNAAGLKYLFKIDMLYNLNDPNRIHFGSDESLIGNTGWFNENFNGGLHKFSQSIVFKQGGNEIDYADYAGVTDVEITVTSDDGVFSNNNTKFVLNHFILPEAEDQYVNTSTDFFTNFMFDRALQTVGSSAVDGDQFGTDKQVLKNISATFISASEILITSKIDLSGDYSSRIEALANKQMVLSVTIQDHTKSTIVSDVEALFSGISTYSTDLSNAGVGSLSTEFNYFPSVNVASSTPGNFIEDTLRGKSIITVDITNDALIKDVSIIIRAEKNTGESFVLEQKNFSFSGAVIQSGIQQINIEEERGFILGPDNPFNVVSLKRRSDLDSGNDIRYELIYSFKIRWEDFIKLAGVNSDFYDVNEDFNGFNQNWNRYFTGAGWSIKYVVRSRIEESGFINTVEEETTINAYGYEDATDWTQQTIKVYDIDTNTEIPDNVLSDKVVRIEAEFTKDSGSIPDLDEVEGMIEVEPSEQGGINTIRNISTVYEHETSSPFISVLGNKLLKKEKNSNVYKFTANIDGTKLAGSPKLSARIYDLTQPPFAGYKQFEDDDLFEFEDGINYDFEDA